MLLFVRNIFRQYFSVILWLILISLTIVGGIMGGSIGLTLSSYPYGSNHVLYAVIGAVIGIIIGAIFGLITVISFGGVIATFLFIDENLKILGKNTNKMGGNIRTTLKSIDYKLQLLLDEKQNKA